MPEEASVNLEKYSRPRIGSAYTEDDSVCADTNQSVLMVLAEL